MQLTDMTWPQIETLSRDLPVVIPIAALEQHGHHLPVFTDSLLLGEVIRRVHQELESRILLTPLMWLGNSEHHLDFPGTLSAAPRTYLNLLSELVENYLFHGFRTIVLVNGHGGNMVPAQQCLFEVRQKHRNQNDLTLLTITYWNAAEVPADSGVDFTQNQMGHAGEWETSMMLRIRPELVGDYQSTQDVSFDMPYAPAQQSWITKDRSTVGHIGVPRLASDQKGEILFQTFSQGLIELLGKLSPSPE